MERLCRKGKNASAAADLAARERNGRPLRWGLAIWVAAMAAFCTTWALATSYLYDSNGRLVLETNDAGQSARYVYDEMGNLVRIERLGQDDLTVAGFNPGRGAVGVEVKVRGRGFSATPAQNAVTFNGTPAVVAAATTTELTTHVPPNATTGPIAVAVGAQSDVSAVDFIVDPDAKPPRIDAVAPLVTAAGGTVTVDGAALEPFEGQTYVKLNGVSQTPASVGDVQLQFPVAPRTGSGKVSVGTAYGLASSAQDVVVLPAGYAAGNVQLNGRLIPDGAAINVSLAASGHSAAVLFDGQPGQLFSLQFGNVAADMSYYVYDKQNQLFASGTIQPAQASAHLPPIPVAGTYLVLVSPYSAPSSWNVRLESAQPLQVGAAETALAAAVPGQGRRFAFDVTQRGDHAFAFADIQTGSGSNASLTFFGPAGDQIGSESNCYPYMVGCDIDMQDLPVGRYSAVVAPPAYGTSTVTGKVSVSAALAAGALTGTPLAVTIPRRGQDAVLTFAAAVGDPLAIVVSDLATTPGNRRVGYSIVGPDGANVVYPNSMDAPGEVISVSSLPANGMYRLILDPQQASTASFAVKRIEAATGTLIVGDPMTRITTQAVGQAVTLAFSASEGADLGIGLISHAPPGDGSMLTAYVTRASDGSQVMYQDCFYYQLTGCDLDLENLAAGNYRLTLLPKSYATNAIDVDVTLSADAAIALQPGSPASIAMSRPGQNGQVTFEATAGDRFSLLASNIAFDPAMSAAEYEIRSPNGSVFSWGRIQLGDGSIAMPTFAQTGTYTLWLDPHEASTAQITFSIVEPVEGAVTIDGAGVSYSTTQNGQNLVVELSIPAPMRVGIGLTDVAQPGPGVGYIIAQALGPDGNNVSLDDDNYCHNTQCSMELVATQAGVHRLIFEPTPNSSPVNPAYTGVFAFKIFASTEVTATAQAEVPLPLAITRPGQRARVYFDAVQGQGISVLFDDFQFSGINEYTWVNFAMWDPAVQGVTLDYSRAYESYGGATLFQLGMPATKTYLLTIKPDDAATASMDITVLVAATGTIAVDGAPVAVATTERSRLVKLTFDNPTQRYMGLGIQDLVLPDTVPNEIDYNDMHIAVRRPIGQSGSSDSDWCRADYDGTPMGQCDMDFWNLAAGQWEVWFLPKSSGPGTRMEFTTLLTSDVVTQLVLNQSTPLVLSRRGQNASLMFNGTAGQTLALVTESLVQDPVPEPFYDTVRFEIRTASGGLVNYGALSMSQPTFNIATLPSTGTYRIWLDPSEGRKVNATVRLTTR